MSSSPKGGKTGSPMGRKKPEVNSPKSESQNSKVKSQNSKEHSELKQPPTATPQPQTMEVHHHPQLEHKPKPWKEYLLEGLMIFIAVTMGFFAESLREHIANKDKEIIASLVRDVKKDTST